MIDYIVQYIWLYSENGDEKDECCIAHDLCALDEERRGIWLYSKKLFDYIVKKWTIW